MTARPTDWSPLDRWDDPIPGDPDEVQAGANRMSTVARTIAAAAENLRTISASEGMESEAVAAFRERAREVAAEIELAKGRYENAGIALAGYVEPLRNAQARSVEALEAAREARAALTAAQNARDDAWSGLVAAPDDVARETAREDVTRAQTAVGVAADDLAAARATLQRAIDARDEAAETAAGGIEDAMEINDLDDSRWRQFLNKNAEILDGIATVLGVIGAGIAIASLFIPGVNLVVLGLLAGGLAAGINFALAENGNKGWGDFALDAIGLATLGIGKIGAVALRGARASRAAQVARSRAAVLTPARPVGTPRAGRVGNAARRQRAAAGRRRQQAEYTRVTTPPVRVTADPRTWLEAARANVRDNGLSTVLLSGGGDDAYQMAYYQRMALQGSGGGQAADDVLRIDLVRGQLSNAEGAIGVYSVTNIDDPVTQWVGDRVDDVMPDQRVQDEVGGHLK